LRRVVGDGIQGKLVCKELNKCQAAVAKSRGTQQPNFSKSATFFRIRLPSTGLSREFGMRIRKFLNPNPEKGNGAEVSNVNLSSELMTKG